jgi:hypothetical protein
VGAVPGAPRRPGLGHLLPLGVSVPPIDEAYVPEVEGVRSSGCVEGVCAIGGRVSVDRVAGGFSLLSSVGYSTRLMFL